MRMIGTPKNLSKLLKNFKYNFGHGTLQGKVGKVANCTSSMGREEHLCLLHPRVGQHGTEP